MGVRLDHSEDTLNEVHEINVAPFMRNGGYLSVALVGMEKMGP